MPQENWCFHFARGSNGRPDVGRRVSSHRPIDPSSPSGAASSAAEAAGGDLKAARQEVRSCRAYLKITQDRTGGLCVRAECNCRQQCVAAIVPISALVLWTNTAVKLANGSPVHMADSAKRWTPLPM